MPQISLRNYVAVAPRGKAVAAPVAKDANFNVVDNWDDCSITALLKQINHNKTSYSWFLDNDGISEAERSIFDSISVTKKSCNIASNRIFIGGLGSGGTMALRLALLYPEYFTGVAVFDAKLPDNANIFCYWNTARNLALFLGLNQSDKCSSAYSSRMLELFYSAGFKLTIRDYQQDAGNSNKDLPKQILQEINRWMMGIVCGEKDQK
jgi:phospholipase/carboxylesterase